MRLEAGNKKKYRYKPRFKQFVVWLLAVAFSLAYVVIGNRIVSKDLVIFSMEGAYVEKAVVTSLGEMESDSYDLNGDVSYENNAQYFHAELTTGESKGSNVLAAQTSDNYTNAQEQPVAVGDKVILYNYGTPQGDADWIFGGYARLDTIIVFGIIFFALLLLFGHIKGLNTIVSLSFTCLAVFAVFVPSVLNGFNIYLMSGITCVFTIIMTLLITNGATPKSFTTILGCSFGVAVAACLTLIFDKLLRLTGMLDEHSIYLSYLDSGVEINLNAMIFGMIIIGAMGAVMDVAMDISSALSEVKEKVQDISFKELYKSGMTIGRDIMGTMANTLVLAYIGSSLCSILLLITYSSSLRELLNRENIIVEILQALVGSSAILLTIPLTTLVCCILYKNKHGKGISHEQEAQKPVSMMTEDERQVFYYDGGMDK